MRELHHRQVTRHFQAELVTCLAVGLCCRTGCLLDVGRYPSEFRFAGEITELVGRVQRVFAELLPEFCQALLYGGETATLVAGQLGATQHEIPQRVVVRLVLFQVEGCRIYCFVLGIQTLVGTQPGPELGDQRQAGVVCGAQRRRVRHAVEVADSAPGASQGFGRLVQYGGDGFPVCREVGCHHNAQCLLTIGQQMAHCRLDIGWRDLVEGRQVTGPQQGVSRRARHAAMASGC